VYPQHCFFFVLREMAPSAARKAHVPETFAALVSALKEEAKVFSVKDYGSQHTCFFGNILL